MGNSSDFSQPPVLLTGPAPGGIGDYAVRSLARAGPAAILLVGRSPAKYTPVVDAIRATDPSIVVRVYGVELASLKSVREGAEKILAENDKIDIILNSAGVIAAPLGKSVDGVETHFATNHLGHFLLTNLLIPALRKSTEPRVVNVSSGAQMLGSGGTS